LCPVPVPSDGQTVPKESDTAKKANPAVMERNFIIFGPFFVRAFFDFLLTRPPAGEIQRRASRFSQRKGTIAAIFN
jgi:hypothetical protein